ncbi:TPA: DNA adenine methylase [Proteus mirabilis]|uniref:DNA adenine methylase n=1 Tax=Proteus mirabilis TaxID=584 RepID=UPI000BA18090|nr:DNA adenine methylase [Proteus mirabilis]EKV9967448.1 DNA adenine methylase [Proteus mirabilis]ELB1230913.1 DNA adenine methylase [Proteus mirabilis]MBG2778334.1 DNA adenine methylase [Proteus mirabilis]MBG2794623.1 DNA adenine methylase [Proteus mirabilis]MDK6198518.1 DNA adenine methylase [Proteus mirabilis]
MFYTPLRYPGGKGKLSYYIKSLIDENSLNDGSYIEPYAGGAGVALELLLQEYVRYIHINDIDIAIYSFWNSILNNTENFSKLVHDTKIDLENWEKQKNILLNSEKHSTLEIGFATFFLNRTNRSGILKAGVIGGKAQLGKWKIDVRFNKKDLLKRIEKIANYSSRIYIYNLDTLDLLKSLPIQSPEKTLLYLDPPYYVKGQGLYRNFYEHDDHVAVMNALNKTSFPYWIVSYDNHEEIKNIYNKFRIKEYDLQYTAHKKRTGGEIMIFSDQLKIPNIYLGK